MNPDFDKLWSYNNPGETESKFQQILAQTENTAPQNYRAELLTQIARAQGLQSHFDQAHQTLDRVEKLLPAQAARETVRYLLERGRVFNSSAQPEKALPFFHEAWQIGQSLRETRLAFDALHMIAIAQPTPALRAEWNLKGIAAAESTNDPAATRWLPAFYNNLGEAYAAQALYAEALDAFQKLNAIDLANGHPPDLYTQKDIARMLRLAGRAPESFALIQPLHQDLEDKNTPDPWIDEEMAENLLLQGKKDQATQLFQRAYPALSKNPFLLQHEPARIARLKQLSGS